MKISMIQVNTKNMLLAVTVIRLCVDDKFMKPFKPYLDEDVLYNIINILVKESQYCSDVTKNYFEKEIVMTAKC